MDGIRTTCPYCGVGCGIVAEVGGDGRVAVKGDPDHPANRGRICSKGAALGETLDLDGRLLYPEIDGERVTWSAAIAAVANGFKRVIKEHGPDAVAFYVSGQLLTEDYYVANKLMKGFIGSANIDTNSRLCMASSVAGHKRAFGSDTVPGCYEDLELADLIVLVGSNTAWCHPVVYQRIAAVKAERPDLKLVVIDPRRTATCEIADLHLPIAPGGDVVLFNGLLNHLRREDRLDFEFMEKHTEGYAEALAAARESAPSIPAAALACGVEEDALARFYRLFATTEKTVTVYSQGVNQSSSGTDKVNAIINCHLATGRIGKPGTGPFSITGQPNAMGGREVGGLANQLAAHMDFDAASVERVARFWKARAIARAPGRKAVEMFQAIESGAIKAVWIMATNPAVSLPDAERARSALAKCELVVVSDCVRRTDTADCADILLPAAAWGEKDGTVTNSERRISRQRAFSKPAGEAKPDWWIVTRVARRMGYTRAFTYEHPAEILREHARLSGYENDGARDFDISAWSEIGRKDYGELAPTQWPIRPGAARQSARMFSDGRFYTASGKARFIAVQPRPPANAPDQDYPLILNTGRVRDHWHTMTRTGNSARLSQHTSEPIVVLHPEDAQRLGLRAEALARVASRWGEMIGRVEIDAEQRPGSVFVPMHWNSQYASLGRIDAVVNPATDPISGQPELKHTPVRVSAYQPRWYGFVLTRAGRRPEAASYWVAVKGREFWRYELAGETTPEDWPASAREWLGGEGEWIEFQDSRAGRYRAALIADDRLQACVFIDPTPDLPARAWLGGLFTQQSLSPGDRLNLLAGRPRQAAAPQGRTVCACFGVSEGAIVQALRARGMRSVEEIGEVLRAGTNCGSCIPELKALIAVARDRSAA